MIHRPLCTIAGALGLMFGPAFAQPTSPEPQGQPNSAAAFSSHVRVHKPFDSTATIDADGTRLYPNGVSRTSYYVAEIPNDATAVQVVYQNQGNNSWVVTDFAVSGSSQLAAPGYSGSTPGIDAFDDRGNRITDICEATSAEPCWSLGSFGNGGADSTTLPPTLPRTSAPPPLGITVPPTAAKPIPSLVYSDWVRMATYTRRDGYPLDGMSLSGAGPALDGLMVSGTPAAGSVPLSGPVKAAIPSGTTFTACTALTTSAPLTPSYTIRIDNTAGIVPGMHVVIGGLGAPNGQTGAPTDSGQQKDSAEGGYHTTVAAVAGENEVRLTDPLPGPFAKGFHFAFILPLTLTAPAERGADKLFVQPGLNIAANLSVIGTFVPKAKVGGYNPTTGELDFASGALSGDLKKGDPVAVGVVDANAATEIHDPDLIFAKVTNTQWLVDGGYVTGANLPAHDPIWDARQTMLRLKWAPTALIAAGQLVHACRDYVTSANVSVGARALPVDPPYRLILVRTNVGSKDANFWGRGYDGQALYTGIYGLPWVDAGFCAPGVDGVREPGNIGNTGGGCNRTGIYLPYMIKTWSPQRGINILMINGDSHFSATGGSRAGLAVRIASLLSTPQLPVAAGEFAWGGSKSPVFGEVARQAIGTLSPDIALIAGFTFNDPGDEDTMTRLRAEILDIIDRVRRKGGLPVLLMDYVRQSYGCNTVDPTLEANRQAMLRFWAKEASSGLLYFDMDKVMDPGGTGYFSVGTTDECVHANDHAMMAAAHAIAEMLTPHIHR
jgi:hypothetical protein